jgi:hypothetical protein
VFTGACAPGDAKMESGRDKKIKRVVRKQLKNLLTKLLSKSLMEDDLDTQEPGLINAVGSREESLNDQINLYGFLINPATKQKDLIFGARTEHFDSGRFVFYSVGDDKLFTFFPAAGIYQGPYVTNKPVFVEVCARFDDMYICKAADKLRYVELMGQNKEN